MQPCSTIDQAANQRFNHDQNESWPQITMRGTGLCQAQCTHMNQPQLRCEEVACGTPNAYAPQRHTPHLPASQIHFSTTNRNVKNRLVSLNRCLILKTLREDSLHYSVEHLCRRQWSESPDERAWHPLCCCSQLRQSLSNSVCPSATTSTRKCNGKRYLNL